LQSKVALTLIPGCVTQWGLGAQFVTSVLGHLSGNYAFFMPNQGYFRQFFNHFVIESRDGITYDL